MDGELPHTLRHVQLSEGASDFARDEREHGPEVAHRRHAGKVHAPLHLFGVENRRGGRVVADARGDLRMRRLVTPSGLNLIWSAISHPSL